MRAFVKSEIESVKPSHAADGALVHKLRQTPPPKTKQGVPDPERTSFDGTRYLAKVNKYGIAGVLLQIGKLDQREAAFIQITLDLFE